jgi:hypothetical protein
VDCPVCVAACSSGALAAAGQTESLSPAADAVLVIPSAILQQFGPGVSPDHVLAALAEMGYRDVRTTQPWEDALRAAVLEYAAGGSSPGPVISPGCPAVVNLIATRFPSLLGQLAPFLSAMEAVRDDLGARPAVFVAACPCAKTALESGPAKPEVITPAPLLAALLPRVLAAGKDATARATAGLARPCDPEEVIVPTDGLAILRVTGMSHVMRVLEETENGLMGDVSVLELFACDGGCFGAPGLSEDPYVARLRARRAAHPAHGDARAVRRKAPVQARAGLRLDADMAKAIQKLSRMQEILRTLPGIDCGQCGAPTCAALAEDVVLGRAAETACPHRTEVQGNKHESK